MTDKCIHLMLLLLRWAVALTTGYYKYQMGQYTWTIVTLVTIVFQMKYILNNIFNGAIMLRAACYLL